MRKSLNQLLIAQVAVGLALTGLVFWFGGSVQPVNAQGQAAQYRQAAATYRQAAAKCPPRSACYLANAAYNDCLANRLDSGSQVQCSAPSCDMTQPSCNSTASQGSSGTSYPGVIPSDDQAAAIAQTAVVAFDLINGWMERRAERKRLREARQARESQIQDSEEDERARERERLYRAQNNKNGTNAAANKCAPSLVGDASPAFSSTFAETESWTPWYSLQDEGCSPISGLDIAYWYGGNGSPSSTPRDFPTQWVLRNRSNATLTIEYEMNIQCVEQCVSGWYKYTATIPAGKIFSLHTTKYMWQTIATRVTSIRAADR